MLIVEEWIFTSRENRTSHLDLSEPCLDRGGNSTVHKGVLAQYLNTNIPYKPGIYIDLCHACGNGCCSNPKHLYWGTRKENLDDSKVHGTWKSGYQKMLDKYGEELTKTMLSEQAKGNSGGSGLKGKPSNNKLGVNQYTNRGIS